MSNKETLNQRDHEAAPPPVKEARNEKDAPSKNRDNSDGLSFEPGWLNNKRSLGSSVDHSTRFTPSKYKYSKEELLSLWKPQGPLPPDSAPYPIVTTEECLTPVNLLPSEQQDEKATAYRRTSLGRGRGSGSGRGRGNRPLWADDDQSDSFVLGEKTLDRPLRRSTVDDDDDDDELLFEEGNDRTPGKHRSPVHSPQDTGSESEQPQQKDSRGGVGGIEGSYTWQYRDPQGNVQGPFSALEMGGWYDAGYFGPELMVKRQDYPNFVYLRNLLRKDGESPFAEPKTSGGKVVVLDEQLLSESDDEEHIQLQKASDKVSELDIKVSAKSISSKSAPTPVPASTPPASIVTPIPTVAPAQTPIPTPISAPTVPRPSAAVHSQLSSMKSTTTATPVASTLAQPKAQPKATSIPATTPAAVPASIPATVPISTPATLPTTVSASTAALVHNLIETGDEGKTLPRRSSIEPISAARSTLTTSGSAILAASPVAPTPEEVLFVERFGIAPKPQQVLQGNPFQQPPQFQQMGHPPHPLQQLHPQGAFPPMSPLRRSDGMSQRAGMPPSGIPPSGLPPAGLPPFPTAAFSHEMALMYAGWQGPGHAPPHLSHDSAHQQAMHQAIHKQPAKHPQVGMLPQPPYHDQFLPPHPFLDPQQQFILQQQILQQQLLQQERNFLQQQAQAEVVSHEPLRRKSGVFLLDESGMAVQIATPTGAQKDQPAGPPSSGNPPPSDSNSTPSTVPIKEGSAWGQKPDAQAHRMSLREIQEEELRQQSLARNTDPKAEKTEAMAQSLSKSQGNVPAPSAEGFFWDLPAVVPTTPLKSSGSIPTPTPTTPALSQPSDRRQSAPSVSFPQAELPRPVVAPLNDQPSNMVAETKESRKKKDKVAPTQQAQSQPQVSTPPPQKPLSKSQTQIQVPPQQQPQPQPQPEGWGITSQPKRYPSLQDIQAEELQQQQQQQFASPTADLRKSAEVKRPQQLSPVQQPERKVVSLREIQEEEMRQAQRRKEADELQRQEALKQQALLAQQQAAIRWGPSQPIVPDVAKPLSLSQIQEEEQRKREMERKRKADLKKKEEEEGRSRPTFPSDGLWAAAAAGNQPAPLSVVMKEQMEQKKDATSKKEQQQAAAKKSDRKAPESAWNTEKSAPRLASESEKPKPQPPQAAKQAASKTAAAPAKKVPAKQAKSQNEDIFFWDPVGTPEKPVQSQESPATSEKPKTAQSKSAKNSNKSAFGGPAVSNEFMSWCQKQLKSLTGNSDTTLAEFLVSVQTPDEVSGYIREYLGSSERVSNFASEFLRQREFNVIEQKQGKAAKKPTNITNTQQAQVKPDKKKRMHKLDPDMLGFISIPPPVAEMDE